MIHQVLNNRKTDMTVDLQTFDYYSPSSRPDKKDVPLNPKHLVPPREEFTATVGGVG